MTTTGILPNWSETYSTASSSSLVSESGIQIPTTAPQDVSEPVQDTSSDAPLEQSTQNIAVMTTTTTSMTSTLTSTLKRKHATLGLSNNSTKKLNEPPEICSECSIIFPTGLDLKKHIDLAHQGRHGKSFKCSQCAQEFDEKLELKSHLEDHAKEKPFACEKCGLSFANQAGLKRHWKRIHEKSKPPLSCQQCGKLFYEKHDLTRHEKIHSASKCLKCNKPLNGSSHVCKTKKEEAIPAANEELKCKICSVQLETKVSWGYHMWKHTKDPSFIQSPESIGEPSKKVETNAQAIPQTTDVMGRATSQKKTASKQALKQKASTSSQLTIGSNQPTESLAVTSQKKSVVSALTSYSSSLKPPTVSSQQKAAAVSLPSNLPISSNQAKVTSKQNLSDFLVTSHMSAATKSTSQQVVINPQKLTLQQSVQPYKSASVSAPSLSKNNFSGVKMSSEILNFPRAPEAHATSYTQISQPLCLQTSRLIVEEPVKPLNMQVNANQM